MILLLALISTAAYLYKGGWWDRTGIEEAPEAVTNGAPAGEEVPSPESRAKANTLEAPFADPVHSPHKTPESDAQAEVFGSAIRAFDSGDYGTAVRLFEQSVAYDKRSIAGVGLSYYKLGDYDLARRWLERAVSEESEAFIASKFLALAYYKNDELQNSLRNAEAALALKHDQELEGLRDRVLKEIKAQEGFIAEETLHFKVVFDGYEHGDVDRRVLGVLEDAYREIGREFDYFPSKAITVVLYTQDEFRDVTEMPGWVRGVYDGKIRLPVKGMDRQEEGILKRVLFHEYVHAMVHSITSDCPLWVNEGLAEYFSEGPVLETRVGQAIPLARLERSFPLEGGSATRAAYMESHEAVSHLIRQHGLYAMKLFLEGIAGGKGTAGAFVSAFYTPYNDFLGTWGRG